MLSTRAVFDELLASMTLYVVFTLVSSFRAIRNNARGLIGGSLAFNYPHRA